MTERTLPLVPPNKYNYLNRPTFVKYDGKWHVWGPIQLIREDTVCRVYKFETRSYDPVHILKHVAYRLVRKHSGLQVEFIMATFDRVVEESPQDVSTHGGMDF